MDYKTKATSRKDIRWYAIIMRAIFAVAQVGAFPVLYALEHLHDVFPDCNYLVLEDIKFPPQTMARCVSNDVGGFTIEIRQSVYDGAYEKQVGAFLGFICHEICHVFLFKIGFTPIYERSFKSDELPPYCSVEWQAKALCGEVMIPYNESIDMSVNEICRNYHCSRAFAEVRYNRERRQELWKK
jgi:hypothetical protein